VACGQRDGYSRPYSRISRQTVQVVSNYVILGLEVFCSLLQFLGKLVFLTTFFHILSNSLFTTDHIIRHCIILAIECIVQLLNN
jgi:hypothetical protein